MVSLDERLANVQTFEATVVNSANVVFGDMTAKIMATNDSTTKDLTIILVTGEDLTLKPTETITIPYRADSLVIKGNSVPYRVWGFW